MRGLKCAVAIAAAAALWAPAGASAGTPDQQQTEIDGEYIQGCWATCTTRGQTFTPSRSGSLDQLDLHLVRASSSVSAPLTVEIRRVGLDGCPSADVADVLAAEQVPASEIPFDSSPPFVLSLVPILFGTPADLDAGTQYAILIYTTGAYLIGAVDADAYAGGRACGDIDPTVTPTFEWDADSSFELAFTTYAPAPPVTPPPDPPGAGADADPPETTITKGPPSKLDASKAKFKFTSDEEGSTFECKVDRRKFKPCTSPRKVKRLDEGKHKFKVRAVDAAGNVDSTPAKDRFRVVD